MASQLDIVNIALNNIGCLPLNSLTAQNASARIILLNWDRCLDSVLREFPWGFATKVKPLNLVDAKIEDWKYAFAYPTDCLKLWQITEHDRPIDYEVRYENKQKIIVTDSPYAVARYSVRIDDTSLYDPSFVEALSYKLAYEMNNSKTGNAQQTAEMKQRYQEALNKAFHDSATEGKSRNFYPRRYIDVRR